ncbi:MAG: hypothetical protein M1828_006479 [Chrysothrix sp. TS-e1954]|nr:MAG: hypothetical protein M1828_006479 [Chrysothrix sp. TS-e1954]
MSNVGPSASQLKPKTKKFGKGERTIPHPEQRASKYYPAEDVKTPKKARKSEKPTKYRPSLQPGTILILFVTLSLSSFTLRVHLHLMDHEELTLSSPNNSLAGRFRGKRVILLSPLTNGTLLITGPFKANGVPLRRVNARYVIATSQRISLPNVDASIIKKASEPSYFTKDKPEAGKSEEGFFKQGEKPVKKEVNRERVEDQRKVDKAVLEAVRKEKHLMSYLHASFSLRNGDRPHEMKF